MQAVIICGCRGRGTSELACDAFDEVAEGVARGPFTSVAVIAITIAIIWPGHDQ